MLCRKFNNDKIVLILPLHTDVHKIQINVSSFEILPKNNPPLKLYEFYSDSYLKIKFCAKYGILNGWHQTEVGKNLYI